MDKNKNLSDSKVLSLDEKRKQKKYSIISLLRDSRRVAKAIEERICILCQTKKRCVGKTGLCAICYQEKLTPEERKIADEEALHKIIEIKVRDDRWEEDG